MYVARQSSGADSNRPVRQLEDVLSKSTRLTDDAVCLPGSSFCRERLSFSNVVFELDGAEPGANIGIFSDGWGDGISIVRIPQEFCSSVLQVLEVRPAALERLAAAVPSECADEDFEIGPSLDRDGERDLLPWKAGIGDDDFVGLYSATQNVDPTAFDNPAMSRESSAFYIVAKAGAGRSAAQFQSRLCNKIRDGKSLISALQEPFGEENCSGWEAHDRVLDAGRRNRARLLHIAAQALGLTHCIDSVADHISSADDAANMQVVKFNLV